MKIALLIDGGFFSKAVGSALGVRWPLADVIYRNALALRNADEELLRIFYYDSRPYKGAQTHPVTRQTVDYSQSPAAHARDRFLSDLGKFDYVALRCGEARARGWVLTEAYERSLAANGPRTPAAGDYELRFEQKGVDMRLGIDVATLALNRYVDRILIASNDTDLIPAFKLARRHGVQVIVPQIGSYTPHPQLVEDSDFTRVLAPIA
ncbi:MAG TPA: NYN domain-containing protein [Opitutaceae bacterium]|nr:NYN domain-containing protein [Opitutaceae bacterium]HND59975.1 NYN domain-containing protein [Opitutaceae bacterium]